MTEDSASVVQGSRPIPGVGLITINRPDRLNALNMVVKRAIEGQVRTMVEDADVRVIVVTGGQKVFVAGTDIAEMRDLNATDHSRLGTNDVFLALRACPKPLIAAVEGYALGGGCELALACDLIVAGESARFGQPEIRVGIMPGAGGTQMLIRAIGRYRTMKLALTGEQVTAAEALAMGMLSEVVETGAAEARAMEMAKTICAMPPLAVTAIKAAIKMGYEQPLTEALVSERRLFEQLFDTEDQVEGMQAFLDKRRPVYRGA